MKLPGCSLVKTHHMEFNEVHGENARWEVQNAACCFEQILEAATPKSRSTSNYLPSQKPSK